MSRRAPLGSPPALFPGYVYTRRRFSARLGNRKAVHGHSPVGKLLFGSIITVLSRKGNWFRLLLAYEGSDDSEEILPFVLDPIGCKLSPSRQDREQKLTFNVVSMFLTSPAISDSEKSILAFHSCVRNASRNCLAVNLPRISCRSGVSPITRSDGKTRVSYVNRDKVLERLAHLQTLDVQVTGVQEIVHPRMAVMICLTRKVCHTRAARTHECFSGRTSD